MDDVGSDSDYSDTSRSTSTTSSSTDGFDDSIELAKFGKETLYLPKELCENAEVFQEFFSMSTWESLPSNFQAYLKNRFLPNFEENNEAEQEKTLRMLFNNEITRFNSSPLISLQRNLEEGSYRPDVLKLRQSISRSRRREQRFQECERVSQLAKLIMISREKLLRSAYNAPPGAVLKIDRIINSVPKMNNSAAAVRAKKRFSEECTSIASQIGLDDLSEDESMFLDTFENSRDPINQIYPNNETKIIGTMCRRKNDTFTTPNYGLTVLNDKNLKQVLMAYKKRKLEEPDRPEFETNDIRLRDVHARTQNTSGYKKSLNVGRPFGRKSNMKTAKQDQTDGVFPMKVQKSDINSMCLPQSQSYPLSNQQMAYQQSLMNNISLLSSMPTEKPVGNSSDSEENIESIALKTTASASSSRIEEGVKKRNVSQPHLRNKAAKKMKLSVNGTAVPETIENVAKTSIKDEPNEDLITLPQYGKVKAATLSDLEGIDMMHIPVDLDESGHIDILSDLKQEPSEVSTLELMQETHACFLSLIRDIFCSTPNHRMKLDELKGKVYSWLSNPITALNDWYCLADNWLALIPSAIHFLAGEFLDQPEDFVPYVEYKTQLNIYQWIGAGRDSDQHLRILCSYWLSRRNEMGCKPLQKFEISTRKSAEYDDSLSNERPISPPPPRCPTNWTVQSATPEELEKFRAQERQRFENPHKAFTYRMHGYESVVGPVKGVYTQILSLAKARGHNMLNQDRPSYVTILTLVRDATARLPNGEGTRADICELLKSSQYISPDAQDSVLQTIVSGALDRMHTEHDPCVKYDTKRKIWIYLHRNRTEAEFERLHQECQSITKPKKVQNRKLKSKAAKVVQVSSPTDSNTNAHTPTSNTVPIASSSSSSMLNSPQGIIKNPSASLKLSPTSLQKVSPKADPLTMKSTIPKLETFEQTDAEAAIDAQATPAILQKPQSVQLQPTTSPVVDSKTQKLATKKAIQANIPSPSLSSVGNSPKVVAIANPSLNQIQAVSTSNSTITIGGKQLTTVLPNSAVGQTVIGTSNQSQINVGGKKISSPVLISQNQSTSLVSQVAQSGQGFVIPINISNPDQIKTISSIPSNLLTTSNLSSKLIKSNQPPALTSTVNARPAMVQQAGKNYIRVTTATAQAGKSLINPQVAAANIQQQKLLGNAGNVTVQQKNPSLASTAATTTTTTAVRAQVQKSAGVSLIGNAMIKSNQPLTPNQQKQILQNIISQQQKQRQNAISISPNTVVLPSGSLNSTQVTGIQQNKPIIISSSQASGIQQQQIHKIIASSNAGLTSTTGTVKSPTSSINNAIVNIGNQQATTNLINPQIIQIHQGGQTQLGKVQTLNAAALTPQQQQNLLQSIKQQQLKLQQTQVGNQQQQSLIIKQSVFQQIQKSNSNTPTTVSVGTGSPKTVTSLIGTNIPNLITTPTSITGTNVVQHQPVKQTLIQQQNVGKALNIGTQQQTVTRVIKPGTSIIQPQVISSAGSGMRTQAGNPVITKVITNPGMAKVISNPGMAKVIANPGQIISLESLLQKQGIAPGTALRVTGAKPNQTGIIQLTGSSGSQIAQYAVVSQGRNLISVGTPQRVVTTQASSGTSATVTSVGSNVVKLNEPKATTSGVNSPTVQGQTQTKIISANQLQSLTAQQLVNAKVIGKAGAGGIRMVNASNLNIAHIRGKPVLIASKPGNVTNQQNSQNVILQSPGNNTNLVISGQTLKVQGNVLSSANVQLLNQSSSQPQTVVLGNQILKVQQSSQGKVGSPSSNLINSTVGNINNVGGSSATSTISSTTTGSNVVVNTNANLNQSVPKTVMLGSTGQTIRVQSPQVHVQGGNVSTQGQPVILGTAVKNTSLKTNSSGQQRVVLAVQGGGQILLPPGFQGGPINLKSLQGLKVVPIGQQQNKGQSDERPVFAQIVTAPQTPRPPNPGGD